MIWIKKVNKDKIELFHDPEYLEDFRLVEVKLMKDILKNDKKHRIRRCSFIKDNTRQITSKFKKKLKMTPITF